MQDVDPVQADGQLGEPGGDGQAHQFRPGRPGERVHQGTQDRLGQQLRVGVGSIPGSHPGTRPARVGPDGGSGSQQADQPESLEVDVAGAAAAGPDRHQQRERVDGLLEFLGQPVPDRRAAAGREQEPQAGGGQQPTPAGGFEGRGDGLRGTGLGQDEFQAAVRVLPDGFDGRAGGVPAGQQQGQPDGGCDLGGGAGGPAQLGFGCGELGRRRGRAGPGGAAAGGELAAPDERREHGDRGQPEPASRQRRDLPPGPGVARPGARRGRAA